jgi:hypothetical protein
MIHEDKGIEGTVGKTHVGLDVLVLVGRRMSERAYELR